jgi:hypothetical protein
VGSDRDAGAGARGGAVTLLFCSANWQAGVDRLGHPECVWLDKRVGRLRSTSGGVTCRSSSCAHVAAEAVN